MASAAYGGTNGGTGGKFRKKPFRKPQTTPYDRPPTAVRPTQIINNNGGGGGGGGWLSKIVDPASKLITAGAHKLFSSVFRKRLLPPPSQQQSPVTVEDERKEMEFVQPESATNVVTSSTNVPVDCGGNNGSMHSNSNGVAELEDVLKQKTFTRSEIDHLTTLLLSRTVEDLDDAEEGRSEPKLSDMHDIHARRDKMSNFPAYENRLEFVQSKGISTPEVRSKVLPGDIASPAEIAKAYMGSRSTKASASVLRLQSQLPNGDLHLQSRLPKEDLSTPSNPLFKSLSPVKSLTQKPVSDIRSSSNGFTTPKFRGRSAIYSMARTPYSRFHPVTTSKAAEANVHTGEGSSYLNGIDNNNPSKKQVLKRRSSVLENDIGSVGPIRRIRQKPNLLHPKTLCLPPAGRQVPHMSGVRSDAAEASSSMEQSSRSLSKMLADNNLPGTSTGYVPSQSVEMAQKIFEQLDKFSPKKSVDVSFGASSSKTPCTESLGSLKPSHSSQDNSKFIGSVESVHGCNHQPQTPSYDVSAKKFASLSASVGPQEVAEGRKAGPYSSSKNNAADYVMSVSVVDRPQKQRAFQMSAHEDCLEMDDELPSNEVAVPTPLTEERQHAKTPRKFPDILPQDQAIAEEKPPAMTTTTHLGQNKLESLANGSSTSDTTVSVQPPLASLSPPATNMTVMDAISAPQSILKSDKVAPQNETSIIFPSSGTKYDSLPSFVSASPSSAKDDKLGTPISLAAEVNGSDKSDSNIAPVLGNTVNKSGGKRSLEALSNGSQANNATAVNGVLSTLPSKADALCPVSFTSSSNNQNSVPASWSSPSPSASFKVSNGSTQSTLSPSTSTPATSSMSHLPGAVTAPLFTFASGFPSPSTTLSTSTADSTDKSGGKSLTMGFGNAASSPLDAKASAFPTEGNNISPITAPTLKNTDGESNKIPFSFQSGGTPVSGSTPSFLGQAASSVSTLASTPAVSFSGQTASSGAAPASTSAPIFPGQTASSALAPASTSALSSNGSPSTFVFGSSGSTVSSSGSIFGSLSSNPASSGSTTASSVLGTTSSATSSLFTFGITSQSPKPTPTTAVSSPPVFSFGLGSAAATSTPALGAATSGSIFGATTSNPVIGSTTSSSVFGATTSSASNSTPFVFGGNSAVAALSPSMMNSPFQSQPAFSNNATVQPFGFGSTPSTNGEQMTMEDTMAEDSLQPSTPAAPTFGAPLAAAPTFGAPLAAAPTFGAPLAAAPTFGAPLAAAPSGGFAFNATPPPAAGPFQFNTQPSQIAPQNPSFQPSGSLEFNGGTNSFSLGTSDKSQRRFIKVKKAPRRK